MNASPKASLLLLLAVPLHAQTAPPRPTRCHMVCMDYDLFGHCIRKERICEDALLLPAPLTKAPAVRASFDPGRSVAAAADRARKAIAADPEGAKQAADGPFQALGGLLAAAADDGRKKNCHYECTLWFEDPTAEPPKPPVCVERTLVCD